jgi:hypothetical protein
LPPEFALWVQLPAVLDSTRLFVLSIPVIPLIWSVMTTLVILAPPVFVISTVYVSSAPDATGFGDAVTETVIGLVPALATGAIQRTPATEAEVASSAPTTRREVDEENRLAPMVIPPKWIALGRSTRPDTHASA